MPMSRRLALSLTIALACAAGVLAAAGPFAKIAEIPIGGAGGFDYNTPDPANHRLYVSHGNEVVVIDTAGTPEANPDAIMYEPTKQQVWSFNHSGKTVTVIDAKTNAIVATTPIG